MITLLLSSFARIRVFAAGTYHIDEMGLSVTIPSGYSVITRDTPSNATVFSELGISKSSLMSQFQANSIYLNAISNTYTEEVVVTSAENSITNFCLFSDTTLNTLASSLVHEFANTLGVTVSKYDIYQHSQAKFIRLYWYDATNYIYGLQYYTVYDNTAMNFTMRSYNGEISIEQEHVIKAIVDSVNYDKEPPTVGEDTYTESFYYIDSDSGVKFTVPANWVEEEFNDTREYLDAKFASTKEAGLIMIFSSTDVWSEMSSADKVGLTRSDINNSMLSKTDVAEMYGTTEDKVSLYMYNGVEYYKCESTANKEMYGLSFDITMNQLLHVKDGWMYTFQFGGTSDHKLYSDFEELVKSVEYPTTDTYELDIDDDDHSYIGNMDNKDDDNSYINDTDKDDNHSYIGVVIFVLIILAVGAVCLVLWIVDKEKQKNKRAITYCRKCGQKLRSDSGFCHMCGARVESEEEI